MKSRDLLEGIGIGSMNKVTMLCAMSFCLVKCHDPTCWLTLLSYLPLRPRDGCLRFALLPCKFSRSLDVKEATT